MTFRLFVAGLAGLALCWAAMIGGIGYQALVALGWHFHDAPFDHPGLLVAEIGAIMQFPVIATLRLLTFYS